MVLSANVYQVTDIIYINLGAHLAYLTYRVSCASSINNLNIYRSPMVLL